VAISFPQKKLVLTKTDKKGLFKRKKRKKPTTRKKEEGKRRSKEKGKSRSNAYTLFLGERVLYEAFRPRQEGGRRGDDEEKGKEAIEGTKKNGVHIQSLLQKQNCRSATASRGTPE